MGYFELGMVEDALLELRQLPEEFRGEPEVLELEAAIGVLVLLAWTLLGGLDALNQTLAARLSGGMTQQLVLLGCFALISGTIDLPLSWYQTFVLEARFGFNKMTLGLWLSDLLKSTAMGAVIGLPIAASILWLMGAARSFRRPA